MSSLQLLTATAPRRLALGGTLALLVPVAVLGAGPAEATTNRFALVAHGDAMYFEANSDNIPGSTQNTAGSLTARAETNSAGNSTAFAGAPYFGATATTAPGTAAGLLGQSLPITTVPGYVSSRFPGEPEERFDGGGLRVAAESSEFSSKSSGEHGGPPASMAPNQQQAADAFVEAKPDGTVVSTANSSVAGIVFGPITALSAKASATITENGNRKPTVTSTASGRFDINGQTVVFNEEGFAIAGQDVPTNDGLAQINTILANANLKLAAVPATTEVDPVSGATIYTLSGLRVTSTQTPPQAEEMVNTYEFARVQVSSISVPQDGDAAAEPDLSDVFDAPPSEPSTGEAAPPALDGPSGVDTGALTADVGGAPGVATGSGEAPLVAAPVEAPTLELGASATQGPPLRTQSQLLYLVLVLGGLGAFVGSQLFSRFGVLLQLREATTVR